MTDEVSVASSSLECNGRTPPENVPEQVVDVIDGLSKPAGVVPVGQEEKCVLPEENQETETGPQKISEKECEVATKEEPQLEKHLEEIDHSINVLKERELQEPENNNVIHPAKTEEEREVDEASEDTPTVGSENGNEEESCFYDQESDAEETPPNSPTSGSLSGSPKGQPILGLKPEISKHNYSKYDTVSYRKIRKGNTKQRIDEFESMMTL
ncbi:ermin isoform X2 [Pleurodeles waltl]|uniref:ermin isoform X2 n=1 Tax=Pleurodeles waltl TaxID=8319 RepID=UPI003709556D